MSVRPVLAEAERQLAEAKVPSPEYDAAELLAHVLGTRRSLLWQVPAVPDATRARYLELVRRRAGREPLQHLTGTAAFRHVDLAVGPGVFVPRPETELLAGWAVDAARAVLLTGRSPVVVDLGTGSGAIALALYDEVGAADIHAVELDPGAAQWATRNLSGTSVDLRVGDMGEAFRDLDGTVDVVVANPPYIPLEAFESVAPEARDFDPQLALWSGGADGLDAMRVVEQVAARLLVPGGVVGVEHADAQGELAPALFSSADRWTQIRDHRDLAGRPRFVTARLAR